MATQAVSTQVYSSEQEQERLTLLANYRAHDHLATWSAFDKAKNRSVEVVYYPAAWRLYELNLRFPLANFESDIVHMDAAKDFVIVCAKLYLGTSYEASPKRAKAHKQGKLSELDKVETKAMARAARNFGIGTEHALDMDDLEANAVEASAMPSSNGHALRVVESDNTPSIEAPLPSALRERHKFLGMNDDWETVKKKVFKKEVFDDDLTPDQCITLHGILERYYEKQAASGK